MPSIEFLTPSMSACALHPPPLWLQMGNNFLDVQQCFNGAKLWQLGWFADQSLELNPVQEVSRTINLLSFTRYDPETSTNPVVVKINDPDVSDSDYFMAFNRASSFNVGTTEGQDQVNIIRQNKAGFHWSNSMVEARLSQGEEHTIDNFANGFGVKITVNSIDLVNDVASVTVVYQDPNAVSSPSSCGDNLYLFQFSLLLNTHPEQISWSLKNNCNPATVVATGGGYTEAQSLVEESGCFPAGIYEFTITDSGNNGLFAGSPDGSYSILFDGVRYVNSSPIGFVDDENFIRGGDRETTSMTVQSGCNNGDPFVGGDPHIKGWSGDW